MEAATPEEEDGDDLDDILSGLDAPENDAEDDGDDLDDILGALEADVSEPEAEGDDVDSLLASLDAPDTDDEPADETADVLANLETAETDADDDDDDLDDILAGLETADAEIESAEDDVDALLAGLETPEEETDGTDDLDDILAGIDGDGSDAEESAEDDLDAVLAGLDDATEDTADGDDDLDPLLAGMDDDDTGEADEGDDMDALLAGLEGGDDDLDALLADLDRDAEEDSGADDDLDALLAGLGDDTDDTSNDGDDDMDALLAELDGDDGDEDAGGDDDLDALLAGLDDDTDEGSSGHDDLDALLAGLDDDDGVADEDGSTDGDSAEAAEAPAEPAEPVQSPFGLISQPRPSRAGLNRTKFRMAVFGDFTGRAARGLMETGDALASRKAIPLDVDTIDEIIEGFGTTLVLPIGADGAGVEVKLGEMDDLHPDELYDNVELFEAISGVRRQLGVGSMADSAVDQLKSWSETYSTPIKLPKTSAGASMPANLKLSDFQALIGDTHGTLTQATPADEMIARIIGPHVVKAPDAGAAAMQAAVDKALSSAMNLILHHPEFQAIESQWRSLDLLARRIETDVKLEIVLYDVSAEELAADLAAQEDLSESGLFKLVTDVLEPEEGAGGFSALFGMYTFEETPPHAELLARIGQVGLHVDAPFFSAISPNYLDTAPEDRHPLIAKTWDTLRQMPEAAYVALAAPRFLLRQPYGAKSDPVYAFEFEEFSSQEGLKGMLWANPVVLIAILLAGTYKSVGKAAGMDLGSMMTLGDLPFYYVNDRYGDQVALPCTERNLTTDPAQATLTRGYMPVLWMKGRNDIRLGSFRSLGGDTIAGPWQEDVPKPRKSPKSADLDVEIDVSTDDDGAGEDTSLDDLLSGLEDDASDNDDDMSLDDLLAGFGDEDDDASDDDDEMDPELAALLEGL
ncbi:MAG: type VI secretion system contractile sheath large subunit [Tateyamaria sp.]